MLKFSNDPNEWHSEILIKLPHIDLKLQLQFFIYDTNTYINIMSQRYGYSEVKIGFFNLKYKFNMENFLKLLKLKQLKKSYV